MLKPASEYKIAVLGVLSSLDPTYSISGVVRTQLDLLSSEGHQVIFVTTDDFHDFRAVPEGVEIRTYPRFLGEIPESDCEEFESYVHCTQAILVDLLQDCSVCITHDVIFLHDFLAVNWALRGALSKLQHLRLFHWIHSGPSKRPRHLPYPLSGRYCGMQNSELVYVNRTDVPAIAEMFDLPEAMVRVVHNQIDFCSGRHMHPLAREILERNEYYLADSVCVYPTRLDPGKQPERIIKLIGALKAIGQRVLLIICNSYSNGPVERQYLGELQEIGRQCGLSSSELVFTSEVESDWADSRGCDVKLGIPIEAVTGLLSLSDLFVLPSVSEACSLILLEAAVTKNLIVLNDDLTSLHEFGGPRIESYASSRCLYFSFGSVTRPISRYIPDEATWYIDHAKLLAEMQAQDRSLQFFKHVRKKHHPKWVYRQQIQPFLGAAPHGVPERSTVELGSQLLRTLPICDKMQAIEGGS